MKTVRCLVWLVVWGGFVAGMSLPSRAADLPTADDVLRGLRECFAKTARPDGSFQNGIDPEYRGMSDSAYSDLAAVTYAVTLHKTFGWKLPFEEQTVADQDALITQLDGWVGAVTFSRDSQQVIAGGADNSVRSWDIAEKRERFVVRSDAYVAAACVSPTLNLFATGGYGHTATIWNLQTGSKQHELVGHRGAVLAVAFHPTGKTLATSGIDRTIFLWDVTTGKRTGDFHGHKSWVNALAYSPDGEQLFSGSSDGTVRVWKSSEGREARVLDATNSEVRSIAISPDGKTLVAGIRYGQITLWDTATWQVIRSFQGHESDVWAVAFTPDGVTLASGNGDWNRPGQVKLWDVASGRQTGMFQHTGEVLTIAISPDGRYLAAGGGDKALRVWHLKSSGGASR